MDSLVEIAKAAEASRPEQMGRIAGDSASELYAAAKRAMRDGDEKKAKRLLAEAKALGQVEHRSDMQAKRLSQVAKESKDFGAAREDGGRAAHLYAKAIDAKRRGDMKTFRALMAEAKQLGADEHKRDRDAGANFEKSAPKESAQALMALRRKNRKKIPRRFLLNAAGGTAAAGAGLGGLAAIEHKREKKQ